MVGKPTLIGNSSEESRNYYATSTTSSNQSSWLTEMVQLARYLRIKEAMTKEQILDKIVQGKIQNISFLEGKGFCSNGQIKSNNLNETFPKLVSSFKMGDQEGPQDLNPKGSYQVDLQQCDLESTILHQD